MGYFAYDWSEEVDEDDSHAHDTSINQFGFYQIFERTKTAQCPQQVECECRVYVSSITLYDVLFLVALVPIFTIHLDNSTNATTVPTPTEYVLNK